MQQRRQKAKERVQTRLYVMIMLICLFFKERKGAFTLTVIKMLEVAELLVFEWAFLLPRNRLRFHWSLPCPVSARLHKVDLVRIDDVCLLCRCESLPMCG